MLRILLARKKILALFTSTSRSHLVLFGSSFVFSISVSPFSFLFLLFCSPLPPFPPPSHFVPHRQSCSSLVSTPLRPLSLSRLHYETSGASLFAAWFAPFVVVYKQRSSNIPYHLKICAKGYARLIHKCMNFQINCIQFCVILVICVVCYLWKFNYGTGTNKHDCVLRRPT